jgi:hypothetical protein
VDFNDHSNLRGLHAFLSPSNYHWLNYDDQKLRARFTSVQAAAIGTRKHNWAHEAIRLGMRQSKSSKSSIYKYINDGIGFKMMTDFMLFYSENAFGEADTLSFRREKGVPTLRIHDLKTGLVTASITQLEVYAALFCLEYSYEPEEITIILRIYQNDKIIGGPADPARIRHIMKAIREKDRLVTKFRKEVM